MKRISALAAVALALGATQIASAHPGHAGGSLLTGIFHPLTGVDHLAAIIATGIWTAQLPEATWKIPMGFLAAMLGGFLLAGTGFHIPLIESAIGATLLVLGLLITFTIRMKSGHGAMLAAAFAILHGYAHGSELTGAPPAAGFLVTTAGLLAAGVLMGMALRHNRFNYRLAGTAVVAASLLAFAGIL